MTYLKVATNPRYVVFELNAGLNNGGGFFSVFFFLCNAYLQSKEKDIPFYIIHNRWPYAYRLGWHDYFTTLQTIEHPMRPNIYCAHMKLDTQKTYALEKYRACIREIFIPNDSLQKRIEDIRTALGEYTALFVRRGDKITNNEAKFMDVKTILTYVPYTETTTFFVQTDDYTVVEELRDALPQNKIVTIVPPTKRGSWHSVEFKKYTTVNTLSLEEKPKELVYEETEEMVVGLMVCVNAKECWTDDTSNVGRFLKLYSPSTVKVYPTNYDICDSTLCHPAWNLKGDATS